MDDPNITMTGKRSETITVLLKLGGSLGSRWATSGITMRLTNPTLGPIIADVFPLREPDWDEDITTLGSLRDADLNIKGEFTIPRTLAVTGDPSGPADTAGASVYSGSLSGVVFMPIAVEDDTYTNASLLVDYDVTLNLTTGEAASNPVWTFIKDWFGPGWRNFWIFAGIGVPLFIIGAYITPDRKKGSNGDEAQQSQDGPRRALTTVTIEEADEAIKLDPKDSVAYANRGNAYDRDGQYERAILDFDEAILLDPEYARAFLHRGNLFMRLAQVEQDDEKRTFQVNHAILDFNESFRLDPGNPEGLVAYGIAFTFLGQLQDASDVFDMAVSRYPTYAPAYYQRGRVRTIQGEHRPAREAFDEAIRLEPEYAAAYAQRAQVFARLGDDSQAQRDLERAVELGADRATLERNFRTITGNR